MIRAIKWVFCACLLLTSLTDAGEAQILATSGDWKYMRKQINSPIGKDEVAIFEGLCTAQTGNDYTFFSVSIFPDGETIVQIVSDQWDWPERRRNAKVVVGKMTLTLQNALYWWSWIDHATPPEEGGYSAWQILSKQSGKIEVFDQRNRLLASFSSRGFKAMLDRAIRCSKQS